MNGCTIQRTKPDATPTLGDALVLDGQLFSKHTPPELRHLPMPQRGASTEERKKCEENFKQRAAFAYTRHKAPGDDGVTRWRCPFCAGKLRSRQLPQSMRRSRDKPLVVYLKEQQVVVTAFSASVLINCR